MNKWGLCRLEQFLKQTQCGRNYFVYYWIVACYQPNKFTFWLQTYYDQQTSISYQIWWQKTCPLNHKFRQERPIDKETSEGGNSVHWLTRIVQTRLQHFRPRLARARLTHLFKKFLFPARHKKHISDSLPSAYCLFLIVPSNMASRGRRSLRTLSTPSNGK